MTRFLLWTAQVAGLLILLYCAVMFVAFANAMRPFGGIPFSWDLLRLNLHWAIALLAGIALSGASAWMLGRER